MEMSLSVNLTLHWSSNTLNPSRLPQCLILRQYLTNYVFADLWWHVEVRISCVNVVICAASAAQLRTLTQNIPCFAILLSAYACCMLMEWSGRLITPCSNQRYLGPSQLVTLTSVVINVSYTTADWLHAIDVADGGGSGSADGGGSGAYLGHSQLMTPTNVSRHQCQQHNCCMAARDRW